MAAESTAGSPSTPPATKKKSAAKKKAAPPSASAKSAKPAPSVGAHTLRREAGGLVLVLASVAIFLALASFDIADLDAASPGNLIGPAGVHIAGALLFMFGAASFLLNGVLFYLGIALLIGRKVDWRVGQIVGQLVFVLSGAILGHLAFQEYVFLGHLPGGLIGEYGAEFLRGVVGTAGAVLLGLGGLLISLMLVTDLSLGGLLRATIAQFHRAQAAVRYRMRVQREFKARVEAERAKLQAEQEAEEDVDQVARAVAARELEPIVPAKYAFEDNVEADVERKLADRLSRLARTAKKKDGAPVVEESVAVEPSKTSKGAAKVRKVEPDVYEKLSAEIERDAEWSLGELPVSAPEMSMPTPPPMVVKPAAVVEPEEQEVTDTDIVHLAAEKTPVIAAEKKPVKPVEIDFGPQIVESEAARKARERRDQLEDGVMFRPQRKGSYELPPVHFLNFERTDEAAVDRDHLRTMAARIEKTLADFKVDGAVVEICPGPVITMFEFSPAAGVKIARIASLADDLAMALSAFSIRILAPIPGKGVVGIEVPNPTREMVYLKEVIADDVFANNEKAQLPLALGFDTEGGPVVADLARMPHLLVAGATGAGKSVAVNTMIVSLLYKHTPEDVRFIMVDPKMLEFSIYADIPHLLLPVVTDPKQATIALNWAVQEMERRYQKLAEMSVRNITGYNKKIEGITKEAEIDAAAGREESPALKQLGLDHLGKPRHVRLPYIVVIIDEFADLMMTAAKDVETAVARLAQKARAAGIHLILATQRPSTDVITGLIKANFPTRVALRVGSKIDSRVILDSNGAENLLGNGDMLFVPPGSSTLQRVHGAYVSEKEIEQIVTFLKEQGEPNYDESILVTDEDEAAPAIEDMERDEHYEDAVRLVVESRQASISMIQRKLRVGYNRAARMVEMMEIEGIVSAADSCKPREVLLDTSPY
jgi:S-DNA-T family DNA segregation ATPase FtsK/SpoIIIE